MSGAAAHIYGLHTNGTILESVKSVRTAKLKVAVTPEQYAALRATQRAYQEALNFVSQYAFAHGKMSNQKRLQRDTCADVRAMFGLPAQMACNVPRQVGATYKGLWTKAKKNKAARRAGHTKKRYRGLDRAPRSRSVTLTYNLESSGKPPALAVGYLTCTGSHALQRW
jgi:predicted transposase